MPLDMFYLITYYIANLMSLIWFICLNPGKNKLKNCTERGRGMYTKFDKYYLQHERPCCIGYTTNDSSHEFIGEVILKINVV